MSDRLPPTIAALLPDGERLVIGDLTLADVRRVLVAADRCLRFGATASPSDVGLVRQALVNDDLGRFLDTLNRHEARALAAAARAAREGAHG